MMEIVGNMRYLYIIVLLIAMTGCSRHGDTLIRKGEKNLTSEIVNVEEIHISADTTSLRGNFVLMDSSLMFIDNLYCRIYEFSLKDGHLTNTYSRYGQGPNEMTGIMYGSVIHPSDTAMWLIDSSYGVYEFTPSNGRVKFKDRLDFSWDKSPKNDYSSTASYIVMEMSDFGLSLNQIDDSTVLVPVSIVNRNFKSIDSSRYKSGRILGKTDVNSLKIKDLTGSFPKYYLDNPLPFFEFFDNAIDYVNNRLYVNHAVDSLIYCCNYDGTPLYTLGYEPCGVNRDYTCGYDQTIDTFKKDFSHVGVNIGLYYDNDKGLLFRTSMVDFPTGKIIMQVYKNDNLVLEQEMPEYFKLLGKYGESYFGVRFLPLENGDTANFVLYKFTLDI